MAVAFGLVVCFLHGDIHLHLALAWFVSLLNGTFSPACYLDKRNVVVQNICCSPNIASMHISYSTTGFADRGNATSVHEHATRAACRAWTSIYSKALLSAVL